MTFMYTPGFDQHGYRVNIIVAPMMMHLQIQIYPAYSRVLSSPFYRIYMLMSCAIHYAQAPRQMLRIIKKI